MYTLLTKKDVVAFNQEIGESGEFHNESSLDFALQLAKVKHNWLYEASYLIRSLLTDHVFRDGNKRTALLVAIYYIEENGKESDKEKLLKLMKRIAKNNITHPVKIARLLYGTVIEKNN